MREARHIRQFQRAVNLAVRREYLLNQCRTGARQTDNKNRVGRIMSLASALFKKRRRAHILFAVQNLPAYHRRHSVIDDALTYCPFRNESFKSCWSS